MTPRADLKGPGYRAMSALSRATHDLPLDPRLRELIRVRASMLNGCAYCVDMHTKDARAQGETEQRLLASATWIAITINAWNRVAIAGHEQAGEYEPEAAAA